MCEKRFTQRKEEAQNPQSHKSLFQQIETICFTFLEIIFELSNFEIKMPEISRFFGIVIAMFAKDHLPPHFHARYGDDIGIFNIENGNLIEGFLPRRAIRLVQDWAELHKTELLSNWIESQKDNPDIKKIEPLE